MDYIYYTCHSRHNGLPTLAVDLACRTSNPDIELIYESGVCGAHPEAMAEGIADSVVVSGAESVVSMASLFGYVLQGGNVDVGFLGAGQIDRYGSLNTSFIGDWTNPPCDFRGRVGPWRSCRTRARSSL
ncbi:coenzyme A transferase [Rhodococcus sp. SMB37]|nr:coenzyme A transferase [Rhodococcus sp. SMB37]